VHHFGFKGNSNLFSQFGMRTPSHQDKTLLSGDLDAGHGVPAFCRRDDADFLGC
jgi:hypothetical protein